METKLRKRESGSLKFEVPCVFHVFHVFHEFLLFLNEISKQGIKHKLQEYIISEHLLGDRYVE